MMRCRLWIIMGFVPWWVPLLSKLVPNISHWLWLMLALLGNQWLWSSDTLSCLVPSLLGDRSYAVPVHGYGTCYCHLSSTRKFLQHVCVNCTYLLITAFIVSDTVVCFHCSEMMEHSLSELRITVDKLQKRMDGLNDKSEVCILLVKFVYKI